PPVPPRKYWRVGYRNEAGRQAVQSWYEGFRHGARVAREKGYRDRAVVPASVFALEDPTAADVRAEMANAPTAQNNTPVPADSPLDTTPDYETPMPERTGLPHDNMPLPPTGDAPEMAPEVPDPNSSDGEELPFPLDQIEPMETEPNELPQETAGNLPPAPPWHHSEPTTAGMAQLASGSNSDFDPFAGTPFANVARAIAVQDEPQAPSAATASADGREAEAAGQSSLAAPTSPAPTLPPLRTSGGFTLEPPVGNGGDSHPTIEPLAYWEPTGTVPQQPLIQSSGIRVATKSPEPELATGAPRLKAPANATKQADVASPDSAVEQASDGWQAVTPSDASQWQPKR
ncbi:MAG: hypothetical protein KDA92_21370, partial [Planctomycetales bacterium]|nr:hypothetical protein [Planctomycetales bacterium]